MEWIDFEMCKPDADDLYLVCDGRGDVEIARFDFYRSKEFVMKDEYGYEYKVNYRYWMQIPVMPSID